MVRTFDNFTQASEFIKEVTMEVMKQDQIVTAGQIVTEAKLQAPVITGNYRDNIRREEGSAVANAPYSAKLEYVGRKGVPYAIMRDSARKIGKLKGHKVEA